MQALIVFVWSTAALTTVQGERCGEERRGQTEQCAVRIVRSHSTQWCAYGTFSRCERRRLSLGGCREGRDGLVPVGRVVLRVFD